MRWWWIGALAPLLMAAGAPDGDDPVKRAALIEASDDGLVLFYAGQIDFDDFVAFARLVEAHPGAKRLVIASEGGEIRAARLIGSIVARKKLIVQVDHLCSSACTLILLSSPERWIGPAAKIGFHKSYVVGDPDVPDEEEGEVAGGAGTGRSARPSASDADPFGDGGARKVMTVARVDPAFIDRALSTPSADMWYPDRGELLRAGVVTGLADAPHPDAPSWAVDREAVAASLTGPLWATLRSARPALWAKKVDAIWLARNAGIAAGQAALAARSELSIDLAGDMAAAPDELLDRILTLNGAQAAQARIDGYRVCRLSVKEDLTQLPGDPYRMAEEERLYVELLQLDRFRKPIKPGKAIRMIGDFADERFDLDEAEDDGTDMDQDCRSGMKAIEEIDAAPEKKRVTLYRALLSLVE